VTATTRQEFSISLLSSIFQHCVMDDWKLKTSPVVKLKRPNKMCVHFSFVWCFWCGCFSSSGGKRLAIDTSRCYIVLFSTASYSNRIQMYCCGKFMQLHWKVFCTT